MSTQRERREAEWRARATPEQIAAEGRATFVGEVDRRGLLAWGLMIEEAEKIPEAPTRKQLRAAMRAMDAIEYWQAIERWEDYLRDCIGEDGLPLVPEGAAIVWRRANAEELASLGDRVVIMQHVMCGVTLLVPTMEHAAFDQVLVQFKSLIHEPH
jgi:hypothetical protein